MPTLADYAGFLQREPDEAAALMKELLISVTNFFRDPRGLRGAGAAGDSAAVRRQEAARSGPRLGRGLRDRRRSLFDGDAAGRACAAGQDRPRVQVFATDLDEQAIATARDGCYSDADVADVSEERLQRFFQREPSGYRVRRELRELVLFAHHNVIKDPPFSHLDLISCRNLLIYLNRPMQERVIETFHFALRPGGFLFLGTSESPDGASDLFVALDKRRPHLREPQPWRAGRRSPLPRRSSCRRPRAPATRVPSRQPPERIAAGRPAPAAARAVRAAVAGRHRGPRVVHVSERAGRYLQVRGGEPSRDLLHAGPSRAAADLRDGAASGRAAADQRRRARRRL